MSKLESAASLMARKRWAGVKPAERSRLMSAVGKKGGRPPVIIKCETCGHEGPTREMRRHKCN